MENENKTVIILMADDDEDDRLMTKEALEEAKVFNDLRFAEDGEELMDYLYHRGKFSDPVSSPMPGMILLDLNMPRKDGREALREIKEDPELRHIPIVIMTTSKEQEDIYKTYNLGVNSFISKPVSFDSLVEIMRALTHYWFEIVKLPKHK